MARFLNKLFNIRTDEWPRVLLLFSIALLTNVGGIWGTTIAYAAFLKQAGLGALPWVMVASSTLSIAAIAVYTAFADRIANDRLLIALYAICAACIAVGLALLGWGSPLAYLVLYILPMAWVVVFTPHFITYSNSFYDIQSAKRILPVVSTGFRVGIIVAGLSLPLLTQWTAPSVIVAGWLATCVAAIGLVALMPRLSKEKTGGQPERASSTPQRRPTSYVENIREGLHYISQSPYLRWMAVSTLLLMVLMALVEYKSSELLLKIYGTPRELAGFLALLGSAANLVILPLVLFGLSRLIARLGLGNASLLFPVGNLAICGSLIFAPGLITASAGYLDRAVLRSALQSPIDSLLYNAVPLRIKGRARAVVGGLIVPIGSLVGGLLLTLLPLLPTDSIVPGLIGLLAAAYLISAWFIRQHYSQALVKMLEQEDYSFLLSQEASDLSVADPATLAQLQKKLQESSSHEIIVFIAKLISQIGGSKAIPILAPAIRSAAEARTRSALVDVLVAADLRDEALRQLYSDLLADPDGRVRQSAIAGLEALAGPSDRQFLLKMLEMAQDPDLDVRAQALAAITHSGDFYQFTPAAQALDQLLNDESPEHRLRGVRLLGLICQVYSLGRQAHTVDPESREKAEKIIAYIHTSLMDYLDDPADAVRLEAALAIETLPLAAVPAQFQAALADKMGRMLRDPIERVRQSALVVLGRVGTPEACQAMVEALADPSQQVRMTAVNALAQVGRAVIPLVHPRLDSPDAQMRNMASVVLSRVDPKEFGPLIIGTHVTGNLLSIFRNYGLAEALTPCARYPGMAILQCALREQNQQLLDEIFYLLTAVHEPGAVKLIHESLRSENAHTRANAAEALEALTTPQIARLIAPLFEPGVPPAQLLALSRDTWNMEQPGAAQAIRQLAVRPDSPLLRAITAFALGEMGAALAPHAQPPAAAAESQAAAPGKPKARRSALTDLLGALDDAAPQPPAGDSQPERKPRRASDLLGALTDAPAPPAAAEAATASPVLDERPAPAELAPIPLPDIQAMLQTALADPVDEVRLAAQAAGRALAGARKAGGIRRTEEDILLSTIEKIIFLKEVPFFQQMTVEQLKVLASVCEEEFFATDTRIFNQNDPGGVLYVVVNGKVGIELEKRAGSFARLATIEAHSYFGEMNLFDNSPRTTSAIAVQDTLALRLRREPLIALARQYPDMSLELINVLSQRLREASDRIAELTRTRPRELHKLYDQLD